MMINYLVTFVVFPWTISIILLIVKGLIIWGNLGLEFSLKVIFRRYIFRGDSKHFILNLLWWEHIWFLFWALFYPSRGEVVCKIFLHVLLGSVRNCLVFILGLISRSGVAYQFFHKKLASRSLIMLEILVASVCVT